MMESFLAGFAEQAIRDPCHLAFDIGANRGEWTCFLARYFARVVALEPDDRAFCELERSMSQNTTAIRAAVAELDGDAAFYQRPDSLQSSLLERHPIGAGGQRPAPVSAVVTVSTRSVVSLVCEYGVPDFIKIDCEGGETGVMAGMTPASICGARLLIEIHDTAEAVNMHLHRLGRTNWRVLPHPLPGAHPQHFWIFSDAHGG